MYILLQYFQVYQNYNLFYYNILYKQINYIFVLFFIFISLYSEDNELNLKLYLYSLILNQ